MRKKKEGPDARKLTDPKRMAEARRLLNSKKEELQSQEANIFLRFLDENPQIDVTLQTAETLWTFIRWLKKHGYHIINQDEVFCVPFSHLAKRANMK